LNRSDFDFDHDDFEQMLGRAARGFQLAQKRFHENISHWQELARVKFGGKFSVDIVDGNNIDGLVLGKRFAIALSPIVTEKESYAEAILSGRSLLSDENIEICRFLISPNGSIFSSEEEGLLSSDNDLHSYKQLIAIARRVLQTPLQG
jgi:hypothetical protein